MLVFSLFFSCLFFPIIFFTWYNLCSTVYCNYIKWSCPEEKPQLLLDDSHRALRSWVSLRRLLKFCESDEPRDNLIHICYSSWKDSSMMEGQISENHVQQLSFRTIGKTNWIWRYYFCLFKRVLETRLNSFINEAQQSSSLCLMWIHWIFRRLIFKLC